MKKTISLVLVVLSSLAVEVAKADFTFGTPTNLGPTVNSASQEWGPSISADGLELYFGSWRSVSLGPEDIYVTRRATTSDPWEEAMNLGPPVNNSTWQQLPSISADGLTLFFSGDWSGGYGADDLWAAARETKDAPWGTPVNLGATVNSTSADWTPSISADGLELYFCSNRPGGYGRDDLWVTKRNTIQDEWGPPVNLGPTVNSGYRDRSMSISHDGLLLFFGSDRPGGSGGHDLWLTRRATTDSPWETPVNLGPTVNSSAQYDQTPSISAEGLELYFCSNRPGGIGDLDIYKVSIDPIVDLNADGIVDCADMCLVVDNWGTDDSLCDIGPMPWGDGIVDVQDLIILAEHLFEEALPDGCVAYWKLDQIEGNIAYNSTGHNHGTCYGEPIWQPEGGHSDGALEFDGIDDYVETDFVLDPANGAFSAFVWILGGAPGQVIISQIDGDGNGETWLGTDDVDGNLMTGLIPKKIGWISPRPLISESVITDIQWHHVGLVWDGSYRILYIDGIEVAKDTAAQNPLKSATDGLHIGASKNPAEGTFFSGLIDNVSIYDKALNKEEIAALAQ